MKKFLALFLILFVVTMLAACDKTDTTTTSQTYVTTTVDTEVEIYQLLIEAEELSGLTKWNAILISGNINLELPTAYKGVTFTYSSRVPEIINNLGIVTQPDTCWIESREQDGVTKMPGLNDNWPIVVDVTMEFEGNIRTAKLMFLIAPAEGFTCDKYLG